MSRDRRPIRERTFTPIDARSPGVKLHCADCDRVICRVVDPYDGGDTFVDIHDNAKVVFYKFTVALLCWGPKCGKEHLLAVQNVIDEVQSKMWDHKSDVYLRDLVYT